MYDTASIHSCSADTIQPGGAPQGIGILARRIDELLHRPDQESLGASAADALKPLLADPELLYPEHFQASAECYCRHVLHRDPYGRFTILALVWRPQQYTPIHGHTAWGAVGVYRGTPDVESYRFNRSGMEFCLQPSSSGRCAPGDTLFVRSGLDDIHRIANRSQQDVVTIHIYGCDLVRHPRDLNIVLAS